MRVFLLCVYRKTLGKTNVQSSVPPVLVKFYNMKPKIDLMNTRDKGLKQAEIGFVNKAENIYFSHHLTKYYQELLRKARGEGKGLKYKHVWFSWRNTTIYYKESNNSLAYPIFTPSDILQMKHKKS